MIRKSVLLGWGLVLGLAGAGGLEAEDWPRFRGPNGGGCVSRAEVPSEWAMETIDWKVPLRGEGHSSPVIRDGKVFLTSTVPQQGRRFLACLDAENGELLWRKEFSFPPYRQHRHNSFASATPAVDAERVYVVWSTPERYTLAAFDHSGDAAWERNLGPFKSQHGSGASPIAYEDKVILPNDQAGESFLIALDAESGETVWRRDRRTARTAYSTPAVYHAGTGRSLLLFTSMAHGITAVEPDSGEVAWELGPQLFDKRVVSSPIVAEGMILGTCGSGGGGNYVVGVRPPGEEGAAPEEAYRISRSAPYVPTGIAVDGLVFLWSDGGIVTCIDSDSGRIHWRERVGGNYFGSPVAIGDRIFCVSVQGEVVVLKAADEFEVIARNPLGETTQTTPAIANGRMYIRTAKHLWSIGKAP